MARTTELIVHPLLIVDAGEESAVQQQMHHDLVSIAAQETQDLCPRGLLEDLDIVVGKLGYDARDSAWQDGVLALWSSGTLEAVRQ